MSALTNSERSAARAALIKAGIPTRGLDDDALAQAIAQHKAPALPEVFGPEPEDDLLPPIPQPTKKEQPAMPQPQPAMPQPAMPEDPRAALIAQLLAPQAPAFDEEQLIDLIKQHASISLKIEPRGDRELIQIDGAHHQLPEIVDWLSTGTNVYLTGPAGSGKTTLAEQAALALDVPFYSTGAIMASYELLGVRNAHGEYIATPLRQAYEHGGVFLLDEIDGCSARALICFNQLLANGTFSFPDGMVSKHKDFVAVGGANTTGQGATCQYVGRSQLDAATLDRFVQIDVVYDEQLEERLTLAEYKAHGGADDTRPTDWLKKVRNVRQQLGKMNSTALVTPRASIYGARGLAKGMPIDRLAEQILLKHLNDDQRAQLKRV